MSNSTKPFLGQVALQNVTDIGVPEAVFMIPAAAAMPRNPDQVGYPGLMNASAYPSVRVFGQKTPFFTVTAPAKASWFTAARINDLLFDLDSYNNTDEYAVCFYDGSSIDYGAGANGKRIFEGCRCSSMTIRCSTQGPVMVDLTFLARYGDDATTDSGTPYAPGRPAYTTAAGYFSSLPTVDYGQVYGVKDVTWTSATKIASGGITFNRGQGHIHFMDGTFYPTEVGSGMFSGSASLEQSPYGTATLDSFVLAIGASSTGVQITAYTSRDERIQDQNIGFGRVVRAYTLINTSAGGNPAVVVAKP